MRSESQPDLSRRVRYASGDTLLVTNVLGTFDLPRSPSRVIALEGRRDLETALALGRTADVDARLDEYDRLLAATRAAARDALGATVASECVRLFAKVDDLL